MVSVDKRHIQQRFCRALPHYDCSATAQKQIASRLLEMLCQHESNFHSVLEIGCGSGDLSEKLQYRLNASHWAFNDLCDTQAQLAERLPRPFSFHQGDAETLDFPQYYDLIISSSAIQWFHAPKQFIHRCHPHLNAHGYFAFSTFTPENLFEIKQLTQIGLDYPSITQWQEWLSTDFEIIDIACEPITLTFDTPQAVLKHLKQTGVTATSQQSWTKSKLQNFCKNYVKNYRLPSWQVHLTYTPLWVVARKR